MHQNTRDKTKISKRTYGVPSHRQGKIDFFSFFFVEAFISVYLIQLNNELF